MISTSKSTFRLFFVSMIVMLAGLFMTPTASAQPVPPVCPYVGSYYWPTNYNDDLNWLSFRPPSCGDYSHLDQACWAGVVLEYQAAVQSAKDSYMTCLCTLWANGDPPSIIYAACGINYEQTVNQLKNDYPHHTSCCVFDDAPDYDYWRNVWPPTIIFPPCYTGNTLIGGCRTAELKNYQDRVDKANAVYQQAIYQCVLSHLQEPNFDYQGCVDQARADNLVAMLLAVTQYSTQKCCLCDTCSLPQDPTYQ